MQTSNRTLFAVAPPVLVLKPEVRLTLLLGTLTVNAAVSWGLCHKVIFLLGVVLLVTERLLPIVWKTILIGIGMVSVFWLLFRWGSLPPRSANAIVLRILTGLVWVVWFGNTVTWPEMRRVLKRANTPHLIVELFDSGVTHGLNLYSLMLRRYEAAALRLGLRAAPVRTTALVISGGIEEAFDLGFRVEQVRSLRAAQPFETACENPLTLKGVSVSYSDQSPTLLDLSLSLAKGEWIAVAGASGSGKSTLLKAIAGLLPLQAKYAERLGLSLSNQHYLHRRMDGRVGMVFQNPDDQFFGTTPLDDMIWGLEQRGVNTSQAREKSLGLLSQLGIFHLANRSLHHLSFGEKKKAAFASTLVCDPELVLVDEPTIGLDPLAAEQLVSWLEDYAFNRSLSVLWATHDFMNLPRPIRRIALLREGRLFFDGDVQEGLNSSRLIEAGLVSAKQKGVS